MVRRRKDENTLVCALPSPYVHSCGSLSLPVLEPGCWLWSQTHSWTSWLTFCKHLRLKSRYVALDHKFKKKVSKKGLKKENFSKMDKKKGKKCSKKYNVTKKKYKKKILQNKELKRVILLKKRKKCWKSEVTQKVLKKQYSLKKSYLKKHLKKIYSLKKFFVKELYFFFTK